MMIICEYHTLIRRISRFLNLAALIPLMIPVITFLAFMASWGTISIRIEVLLGAFVASRRSVSVIGIVVFLLAFVASTEVPVRSGFGTFVAAAW